MRTTWQLDRNPGQILDLLQERFTGEADVTAVERAGNVLTVRSRAVPTSAYFLSTFLGPHGLGRLVLRARTENLLRITASNGAIDRSLLLEGEANAGVSKVLVMTKNELFPPERGER